MIAHISLQRLHLVLLVRNTNFIRLLAVSRIAKREVCEGRVVHEMR